jgi:hypothetical protein
MKVWILFIVNSSFVTLLFFKTFTLNYVFSGSDSDGSLCGLFDTWSDSCIPQWSVLFLLVTIITRRPLIWIVVWCGSQFLLFLSWLWLLLKFTSSWRLVTIFCQLLFRVLLCDFNFVYLTVLWFYFFDFFIINFHCSYYSL